MAEKKAKRPLFTSPKGSVVYAFLNKPSTKFKADGQWLTVLEFNPEDVSFKKFAAWIDKQMAGVKDYLVNNTDDKKQQNLIKKAALNSPIKDSMDEEGNETGMKQITFSEAALINTKDGRQIKLRVDLFDAKGNKLDECPNIGKGTMAKASFEVVPYFSAANKNCGLSIRLKAVQIIDLVEYVSEGRKADAYGFEAEDGWEADSDGDGGDWEEDGTDDTGGDDDDAAAF